MAKDAARRGDVVEAENMYQHAEHYFRVMRERERGARHKWGASRPDVDGFSSVACKSEAKLLAILQSRG